MKLKVKESRQEISNNLVAIGVSCTDLFSQRSTDQSCDRGIIEAGLLGAQYKLPDTTQFNN
jgi:hypothetical protein